MLEYYCLMIYVCWSRKKSYTIFVAGERDKAGHANALHVEDYTSEPYIPHCVTLKKCVFNTSLQIPLLYVNG